MNAEYTPAVSSRHSHAPGCTTRSSIGPHGRLLHAGERRAVHVLEWAVLVVVAATLLSLPFLHRQAVAVEPRLTQPVKVSAGDTVWSLAVDHPMPGLTTRQTAEMIAECNGLDDHVLLVGQLVRVPVAESGPRYVVRR